MVAAPGVGLSVEAGTAGDRPLAAVAAAWVLTLGFDVFLHGGLLAHLYTVPSPFLLDPVDAFRRIPLGYLGLLALTAALYWLLRRLRVRGARGGFRHGAVSGMVAWGAFLVGLYSISTAPVSLLAGWWIGQTLELGLAGAVLGASLGGVSPKRIWIRVAVALAAFAAATIALQSLGLAPAMRLDS